MLDVFIEELSNYKTDHAFHSLENEWYKDVTVYSLYVDLFNNNFQGLESKLDYLKDLGISCLWLLPILNSPMRDAGFDISDYKKIRPDLLSTTADTNQQEEFVSFINKAHKNGIKIIFDIAVNHTSNEHFWFQKAKKSKDNPYRDYYIWSKDVDKYNDARIIFKGIEKSNWKKEGEEYFFHRFFDFQPDLNYRNPKVLLEMTWNFLYWLKFGVDGFRVDAIPYLWKEEGTDCENLPQAHSVLKFFRKVLDFIRPNTLLLAEACQKPFEVVKYFGDGDECHAAYHFPLMPQIFKSMASKSREPVINVLSKDVTPGIPQTCQWFTFLRCHDELSLELVYVTEEDRKFIHEQYCKQTEWDFRLGQGISARLAELMDNNHKKIVLSYSIMLTLPGTPVIYYGDEFGKLNDIAYYNEMIKLTAKDDTRFLVRGRIDWEWLQRELQQKDSFAAKVFFQLQKQIQTRNRYKVFGRGDIQYLEAISKNDHIMDSVLMYSRKIDGKHIIIINNLSEKDIWIKIPDNKISDLDTDLLGNQIVLKKEENLLFLPAYGYLWAKI